MPEAWVIVDTGSTDETPAIAAAAARDHPWIHVLALADDGGVARGGPIARAFEAGLEAVAPPPDVVIKLDADITMRSDYFARLLAEFDADATLGIASGIGYERDADGAWRQRHVTDGHVWGAARAYRWQCLQQILPLEARMGWDGVDELKAGAHGWRTGTLRHIPFRHNRREGERDGNRRAAWAAGGSAAHYMGYRPTYIVARTLHHALRDTSAVGLLLGYLAAAVRREPRCPDAAARRFLRKKQSLRHLPARMREANRKRELEGRSA
jgi:glycosyltransferase involved in cell wall biosynthesis